MAVEDRPIGFGRLKRKEDPRFIRGQGNYVDDVDLPGMLHGAVLRSPFAHARILSIDTSRALALPGVAAVVTAKDLETLGLAWMPTISYDDGMPFHHEARSIRRPSGSSLGKCSFANASLITTTPGAPTPSDSLISRPRSTFAPTARK